jgi:hypothetical protein
MNNLIKLNLGCAQDIKEGYINIDLFPCNEKVIKMDVKNLDFESNSVDEIFAKDVLEHMEYKEAISSLEKWIDICKPGGKIYLQTICLDSIMKAYLSGIWNSKVTNYMLFAGINWSNEKVKNEDFHKSCFGANDIYSILVKNKMKIISFDLDQIDKDLIDNPYSHNLNMKIWAEKL